MDTVLVIEDSRPMQRAMQRAFEADSFAVELASDGITGLEAFRLSTPTAVVLDLKLPGRHGRDLCRDFKSIAPTVPIIVVSANAEVDDKVLLLELGADDYVTKPFSPKELIARVRRAIRRVLQTRIDSESSETTSVDYSFSDVTISFNSMEVIRANEKVTLTAQEFRLLKYLVENVGKVLSRETLLNEVWGYQNYPTTRTVDNHILRLRQKLEPDPGSPRHFLTLHGAGYKFTATAKSS
ncbi:MAG TPA: response regulator transcription factor [Terriglobales bacterium]|nr:response regulator transcription factor [Terriglobales bacterium]